MTGNRRAAVFGTILCLLFLGRALLPTFVPFPVDDVARGYPFRGVIGEVPRTGNGLTNDVVRQMLPWMQIVRESFRAGSWPLWNRYQFSGTPLLANAQSAPFSPFFLSTLFVPLPKQLVAMAVLKLLAAFLFTYLFLKDDGVSDGAALFGATVFTFSVFTTVYLYYTLTSVTVLLPMLLWSMRRSLPLFTICVAAAIAGGHPESVLHLAIAAAIVLVVGAPASRRLARRRLAAAVLFAVALTAPIWLPVGQQLPLTRRVAELSSAGHASSFPFAAAWFALNPNVAGHPARGTWNWFLNYSMAAPTYAGLLATALAIAALATRNRRVILLLVATAVLFVVSMNWTVLGHVLNAIPPLSLVANDRLRFVCIFFVAVAGAHALDRRDRATTVVFLLAAAALLGGAGWLFAKKLGVTLAPRDAADIAALVAFIAAAALLRKTRFVPYAAFVCAAIELLAFNAEFNAPVPRRYFRPRLPIVDALRRIAPNEPFRITGVDWVLSPNAAAQYGLDDIRGSDPMELDAYRRFFTTIEIADPANDVKRVADLTQPALAFLNVRYALAEPGFVAPPGWVQRYSGPDGVLFESTTVLPRFFFPNRRGHVGAIRQNRDGTRFDFAVDAPEPLLVASSQPLAPGWDVLIDGRRVDTRRINGAFLGFVAPAGHTSVVVAYRPRAFYAGLVIAAIGALVACARPLIRPSATFSPRGGEKGQESPLPARRGEGGRRPGEGSPRQRRTADRQRLPILQEHRDA